MLTATELIKIINRIGPKTEPCVTLLFIFLGLLFTFINHDTHGSPRKKFYKIKKII